MAKKKKKTKKKYYTIKVRRPGSLLRGGKKKGRKLLKRVNRRAKDNSGLLLTGLAVVAGLSLLKK